MEEFSPGLFSATLRRRGRCRRKIEWCDQKRGRRAEIARLLSVQPQAVSNLLSSRQQLTGQALTLRDFLDEQETGSIDNLLSKAV
jgi:hypothetical protein